jgi:hypothetical protein
MIWPFPVGHRKMPSFHIFWPCVYTLHLFLTKGSIIRENLMYELERSKAHMLNPLLGAANM